MNIKKISLVTSSLALVASMMIASSSSADSITNTRPQGMTGRGVAPYGVNKNAVRPVAMGAVTSINGSTITIAGRQVSFSERSSSSTPSSAVVTYTVDATNAVVTKGNASSTVSSIVVGDNIVVMGTVSGTNIVATTIFNSVRGPANGQGKELQNSGQDSRQNGGQKTGNRNPRNGTSTQPGIIGNGQPVVAGKIVTINSNSITITTSGNLTYTIDVANAKITLGQAISDISKLTIGDMVVVQGTINGSSVTASTIMDRGNSNGPSGTATGSANTNPTNGVKGFFGGVGQFFMHMFGF
ncbi:MAG: hypothetical protein WCQ00_00255 [bacterium]